MGNQVLAKIGVGDEPQIVALLEVSIPIETMTRFVRLIQAP